MSRFRLSNVTDGAPVFPLMVLFGLNAVDELDRAAFNVLTPNIRNYFRLDIQGILTVVGLVGAATILLQVPIAYYADRWRRTRMVAAGASAWSVFSVLTGLAPFTWVLTLARAGSSVGQAVNAPTHNSLLADYYEISARPKVYGFHRAANSVGQFVGPLVAGVIAYWFGWRTPFFIYAIPTLVFVVLSLRLQEPVRGVHERRAMGASEETAATEEAPPSYAEAWRILWQVRALRRVWYSFPFLASAFVGFGAILSIYYEQVFGLNEAQRGVVFAVAEPAQILGLLVTVPIANRIMRRDPGLGIRFLGIVLALTAGCWLIIVFAPNVYVAVAGQVIVAGMFSIVGPGALAALSLAIPPRARAMGFTVGALFYLPGVLLLGIIGGLADSWGVRKAMAVMIPVLLLGSAVISSAARFVAPDILRVRTSTVALAEVAAARRRGEVKMLVVKDLDVAYSGVQVLFGVNFEIGEGEIVALLGTNGAGKSTLLKAISGLVEAEAGAIIFDGRDMTHSPPNEVAAKNVLQVPGGRGVFPSLTVAENLKAASWLFRRDPEHVKAATEHVLQYFPILRERWDQPAGNLSGGEQQMLALGMVFISKPRLLMIDELSIGLAPIIVEQLLRIVKAIRDQGTTIILVEQSVNVALTLAETAYFMEKGEIRFRGPTRELLDRPDVLRSVFLEGAASVTRTRNGRTAKASQNGSSAERVPVLEVREVSKAFGGVVAVDGATFTLHEGEILGVIGPNGAGKTTLFDLVSGFLLPDRGRILFGGEEITNLPPDARALRGIGRSFQDARLFPGLTVEETIALALERQVEVRDPVAAALMLPAVAASEAKIAARVDELVELMGLDAFRDKFVSELSTGSRRIVDLACVLAHEPKVILFDEPSSGIAQRETEALGPLLVRIREATQSSLLVIEHDMPLVTSIADEILALDLGRVVTQGAPQEVVNHPNVVASYLGSSQEAIARSGTLAGELTATAKRRRRTAAAKQ